MDVRQKQRCAIEFLSAIEEQSIDIHKCLVNVYGGETGDVSSVRRWVGRFRSGDTDVMTNFALAAQGQPSVKKMKLALISSSNPTGGLQ